MKRKLLQLLVISICCVLSLAFFACDLQGDNGSHEGGNEGKQVPIYQGMTIASVPSETSALSFRYYLHDHRPNENPQGDKHDGLWHGDVKGEREDFDKDKPYPDNKPNETIENAIESSLSVIGADKEIYYATLNEDIYINIHIKNPDNFEILSFTLNGKKYSGYMFEYGSDMQTIILKYNVGNVSGIAEYTIDAIKYIDGTEIKDVLIDGDKTIRAGIYRQNQVLAEISNFSTEIHSVSLKASVSDNDGLIEYSEGALYAVLYDGDQIVSQKELSVGNNDITFETLEGGTLYQYAIVGYYDDLSGDGFGMNLLYKEAFYTDSVVLFDNISVGYDVLSFDYNWHESVENKTISSLILYQNGEVVKTLDSTATEVIGLLSNNEYTLVAEYEDKGNKESIQLNFSTAIKTTPIIALDITGTTQTSLSFEVSETDTDNVGEITKIELLHGDDEPTALDSLDIRQFDGLLSNNEYTVKVIYVYDLNDGLGEQTIEKKVSVTTLEKEVPTLALDITETTQTSLSFEVSETDTDNVGEITKIELLHGDDEPIAPDSLDVREFTGLLSNNEYTVKVTYVYDLNDGLGEQILYSTVSAYTQIEDTSITYALNYDGNEYSVTGVSDDGITSAVILDHIGGIPVTSIGDDAFKDCVDLVDVTIGNNVTTIGDSAFWGCNSLTSVKIPDNVTSIGYYLFRDCVGLTSATIPDGVTCLYGTFSGCTSLTNIIIPNSVSSITDAFYGCTSLTSITIPDNVTSIGEQMFFDCTSLTSIIIPDNITSIDSYAFSSCYNLISVTIGSNVKFIGEGAFGRCISLTSITIPDSVISIGDRVFGDCGSLQSMIIGNGVVSLGYAAFYDCNNLTTVTLGNSVTTIGNSAFCNCSSLANITIPDSVISIGEGAFYNCSSLANITIPDSVISIGRSAFTFCSSLTNIIIPNNVISIGDDTFYFCTSLTNVTIGSSVASIGEQAFLNTKLTSIIIPDSVTAIGCGAFSLCDSLTSISFADTNTWYITTNYLNWSFKIGGTLTGVENASINSVYFTDTYSHYHWYKL